MTCCSILGNTRLQAVPTKRVPSGKRSQFANLKMAHGNSWFTDNQWWFSIFFFVCLPGQVTPQQVSSWLSSRWRWGRGLLGEGPESLGERDELLGSSCGVNDGEVKDQEHHGIIWLIFMGLYGIIWDCMGLYGIVWDYMGLYGIIWDCVGLYGIVWDYIGYMGLYNRIYWASDQISMGIWWVSIVMGDPHSWMVYVGESQSEMDDDLGYPFFRKPPSQGRSNSKQHHWCEGVWGRLRQSNFARNNPGPWLKEVVFCFMWVKSDPIFANENTTDRFCDGVMHNQQVQMTTIGLVFQGQSKPETRWRNFPSFFLYNILRNWSVFPDTISGWF